jgi:hypothetical protein
MQVLVSPTRADIDRQHAKLQWLDIGVISWKNLLSLPRFRVVSWALLMISSIPIHLLANSAIFEVQYINSHFTKAAATSVFVYGNSTTSTSTSTALFPRGIQSCSSIGSGSYESHMAESRDLGPDVETIWPTNAKWETISRDECSSAYASCGNSRKYRSIILVVDWKCDKSSENTTFSRCVYSPCSVQATASAGNEFGCTSTCTAPFILDRQPIYDYIRNNSVEWPVSLPSAACNRGTNEGDSIFEAQSCLVQRAEDKCKIGISKAILIIVVCCVAVKTGLCYFILIYMSGDKPLVTLGDAVESFLVHPDPVTAAYSGLEFWEAEKLRQPFNAPSFYTVNLWKDKAKRQLRLLTLRTQILIGLSGLAVLVAGIEVVVWAWSARGM